MEDKKIKNRVLLLLSVLPLKILIHYFIYTSSYEVISNTISFDGNPWVQVGEYDLKYQGGSAYITLYFILR